MKQNGSSSVERQRNKSSNPRNSGKRERDMSQPREIDFQAMSDIDSSDERLQGGAACIDCCDHQSSSGSLEDDYDLLWESKANDKIKLDKRCDCAASSKN